MNKTFIKGVLVVVVGLVAYNYAAKQFPALRG